MMEEDTEVWQQVFQELIQEVKPWDKWTLTPDKDLLPGVLKPGWTQYQQKTFARFLCPSCSRSWASACVLVIFHMRWCKKRGKGRVKMRVFAQRCNKCPEPPFAAPEFAWDNISRILSNLVFRILKKCYGEGFKEMAEIPVLGDTGLEGPHDSSNCEACLQGFCVQSSSGLASKPPACPLSPTSSKSTREPTVAVTCSNVSCSQPSSKMEKPQASKVDTKASNPTKVDPKVSHTSNPSTVPVLTTQQLVPVSSPAPRCAIQMPSPIKSSRTEGTGNKNSRSKIPEVLPRSSAFIPTISSSFILPTSSSYVPSTSLFVPSTSSSYVAPTSSKMEKPQASKGDAKASNPTKVGPNVSHTPNPSTIPILTTQQLVPVSSPAPRCVIQMPSPVKSSRTEGMGNKNSRSKIPEVLPRSSAFIPTISSSFILPTSSSYVPSTSLFVPSTSSSYVAPTSSKMEKPQASKVDTKASNPTKVDPKVSHTSNPSTVPVLTTQQLVPVSSPAPRCAIQMPSPIKSSRTEGTGNKNSRSKIPEVLPRSSAFIPTISSSFILPTSSSYVPSTPAYVVPSSGRPGANITYQAERSSHIHPAGEPCCCQACCGACHECCSKSCECCCGCFCGCCVCFCEGFCDCMKHEPFRRLLFLIFAAVVVTLFIKYGF